ncbi:MAG: prolyl-tRNA synthetase associated domain-containing protein [Bacteroidales bacterium]|nr:prolyl-tRNA synthetase associated domain-containing protein [Bacteroidales bacterium]MDZ4203880.1 prolyl-tRNA synthetase associated domain-containing protein [Bacteroidales bacterium]
MRGDPQLYHLLDELKITFDYYEHPPVPTVEEAAIYWKDISATHCKNLFFRNHKGNRHYLVVFEYTNTLAIKDLEGMLRQGKLTFASPERMMRFLGVEPGSVTPLGLIHDIARHVHLFLDENLRHSEKISFHPCINTASLVLTYSGFLRFLKYTGQTFEYVKLY